MDISSIIGAVSNFASGGAIGGIMGLGKCWIQYKHEQVMAQQKRETLKIQNEHDLAMADKEMFRSKLEAQYEVEKLDLNNLGESVRGQDAEIKAMAPALEKSSQRVQSFVALMFGFATFSGKMIRQVLTVALVILTSVIFWKVQGIIGGLKVLTVAELIGIFTSVINTILNLTGISVGYWYTTRPTATRR